jgi:hypothetical protein
MSDAWRMYTSSTRNLDTRSGGSSSTYKITSDCGFSQSCEICHKFVSTLEVGWLGIAIVAPARAPLFLMYKSVKVPMKESSSCILH